MKLTFCKALVFAMLMVHAAAQAQPVAWPGAQWAASTPEEQGVDSARLQALLDAVDGTGLDSLMLVRHGKVIAEVYFAPFQSGSRHRINSATKAVVGMLTGIAQDKGVIGSADTPLLDFYAGHTMDNLDDRKQSITLQHLLNMTSGLQWVEPLSSDVPRSLLQLEASRDWAQFVLDRPMGQRPGEGFNYNSGNTHLVSAVLARKSGMKTQDFAARQLFTPLGIADWRWRADPQGINIGGFGLYLKTPDMARLGYLYLHHGEWNGQVVVPRPWADRMYGATVRMNLAPGQDWRYADGWWTLPARRAYAMVGFNGQLIAVLPELDMVAVTTAHASFGLDRFYERVEAIVKSAGALPPNPVAAQALAQRIAQLAIEKPLPVAPASPLAQEVSGKTWRMQGNMLGLRELTLALGAKPMLRATRVSRAGAASITELPLGMNGLFAGEGDWRARAEWVAEDTLMIVMRSLEDADAATYRLRFHGRQVEVSFTNNFGMQGTIRGQAD